MKLEANMKFDKKIMLDDFCRLFHCTRDSLPHGLKEKFESINTNYRSMTLSDSEEYVLEVLNHINSPTIRRNRKENLKAWQKGWSENLVAFQKNLSVESLKPKYFRPSKFFRYDKTVIIPENNHIEYDLFTVIRYYLFQQFFSGYDSIYELGCGSCQNIYLLSKLFPKKNICGLDWTIASKKIADYIGKKNNGNVKGLIFDFMKPSEQLEIGNNSIIFSIHSLEQLGLRYEELLLFLLKKKPALVLHYEPIVEVFDKSNVYDYLALMYCEKRNYLKGYLTTIHNLFKSGKIEIIKEIRPCIGGIYHDSSVIIWRPI